MDTKFMDTGACLYLFRNIKTPFELENTIHKWVPPDPSKWIWWDYLKLSGLRALSLVPVKNDPIQPLNNSRYFFEKVQSKVLLWWETFREALGHLHRTCAADSYVTFSNVLQMLPSFEFCIDQVLVYSLRQLPQQALAVGVIAACHHFWMELCESIQL